MSNTNTTTVKPSLDINAILAAVKSSPELAAQLKAALAPQFTPTWHVDDKGMVILEFSGNPFSKANPYMAGSVAVRFLQDRTIEDRGKERFSRRWACRRWRRSTGSRPASSR